VPKNSRRKRTVTRPRRQSPAPATVAMQPSSQTQTPATVTIKSLSQTQARAKDEIADPSRYTSTKTELKMIGIIAGLILIGIFVLYFLLR
jgi:hypothetical protein